jgi:hypothetical protein
MSEHQSGTAALNLSEAMPYVCALVRYTMRAVVHSVAMTVQYGMHYSYMRYYTVHSHIVVARHTPCCKLRAYL